MSEMPFKDLSDEPEGYDSQVERMKQYLRGKFGAGAHATTALGSAMLDGVEEHARGGAPAGLLTRAIHKLVDRKRRDAVHERAIAALAADPPKTAADPAAEAAAGELKALLDRAEQGLLEEQRAVWNLLKQGLSTADVAARLGKTDAAVRMTKKRALERIRKALPRAYGGTQG